MEYFWSKPVHDLQYESSRHGVYCTAGAASSKAIEGAISACISKDQETFRLYEIAVPLMIPSMSPLHSTTRILNNQRIRPKMVSMTEEEWQCLVRYADRETVSLPIFNNSPTTMSTNILLLKTLGVDLSKYSARTVNIVPPLPEGSIAAMKERRSYINTSKVTTLALEVDELKRNDKGTDDSKSRYDDRMVISSANCLIFIEFPDATFRSLPDAINLDPSFDDEIDGVVHVPAEDGPQEVPNSIEEPYFLDSQEYEGASIDESEDFCARLSRSSSANSGYGNLSPTSIGKTGSVNKRQARMKKNLSEKNVFEYSKTCEIILYSLELPTFQFADSALKLIVAEAVSSLSKTATLETPKVFEAQSHAIKEDLKSFLLESHMSNFTSVLCSSLCQGLTVAPDDILLGLERCCQSTYEVDISVMCRKRYLANLAAPFGSGECPTEGSLCSAFENTLGRLLKGLEEGNVFVLTGNAPHNGIDSFTSMDSRSDLTAVVEAGEEVEVEAEVNIIGKNNQRGATRVSRSRTSTSNDGTQIKGSASIASLDSKVPGNEAPRIIDNIDDTLVDKMTFSGSILSPFERESSSLKDATPGPKSDGLNSAVTSPRAPRRSERTGDGFERGDNTFEGCTDLSGTVDIKEKAPKGRAVFVRFAVVSRTEKSIGSSSQGGTGAGTGTGTLGHFGSSGSYQSLASGNVGPSSSSIVSLGAALIPGITHIRYSTSSFEHNSSLFTDCSLSHA